MHYGMHKGLSLFDGKYIVVVQLLLQQRYNE